MKVGIIGLGRMGNAIAQRAAQAGHEVIGFDPSSSSQEEAQNIGIFLSSSMADLAWQTRVIWLMVPAGTIVDSVLQELAPHLKESDIIIDGGNSKFTDSIRRAKELAQRGIIFLDCGTSGGLAGRDIGFSLMVGGDHDAYTKIHDLLAAIAAPGGLGHVGPSGAGHYVKMVHNGIEYALLQGYAEGFQVLKEGSFKHDALDLEEITRIWNNGAVIRSWILELAHGIFERDQELKNVGGAIEESGTGAWTVEEAHKNNIPVPTIEESLKIREWSRATGGNYATRVVAMLRNAFGGHSVQIKKGKQ